jgi:hypothetical protein
MFIERELLRWACLLCLELFAANAEALDSATADASTKAENV